MYFLNTLYLERDSERDKESENIHFGDLSHMRCMKYCMQQSGDIQSVKTEEWSGDLQYV